MTGILIFLFIFSYIYTALLYTSVKFCINKNKNNIGPENTCMYTVSSPIMMYRENNNAIDRYNKKIISYLMSSIIYYDVYIL